mgnify:CR=1 FL=1
MTRNYQGGKAWRIIDGNFRLKNREGLIATSENNWGAASQTTDDLTFALLDIVIDRDKTHSQSLRKLAKIQNDVSFTNTFSLRVNTGTLQSTEGLIFYCNRQGKSDAGYQLVFYPGEGGKAKVFRVIGNNATEIKAYISQIQFNRDSSHTFEWTRSAKDVMTVFVDGQQLLQVVVPEYQGMFESIGIAHIGNRIVFQDIELFDSADKDL